MTRDISPWWLSLALLGCQPDIGDACDLPSDCSLNGERICDTTFKNGYCTEFNCEPGGCPEEAVCVAFRATESTHPVCASPQGGTRFSRSFCMKNCESNGDCRHEEGYVCVDMRGDNVLSAQVTERGDFNSKVCTWPFDGVPIPDERATETCSSAPDHDFPPPLRDHDGGRPATSDAANDASDAASAADASGPGEGGVVDGASVEAGTTADATDRDATPDASAPVDASVDAADAGVPDAGVD